MPKQTITIVIDRDESMPAYRELGSPREYDALKHFFEDIDYTVESVIIAEEGRVNPKIEYVLPGINMNGSGAEQLGELYAQVRVAALRMDETLGNAAPHGRDYQTMSDDSYRAARKQHQELYAHVKPIADWARAHLACAGKAIHAKKAQ